MSEEKKASKVSRLHDVTVTCDPPMYVGRYCRTEEARAKELEQWVREFHDFIRDHRSQDGMHLSVKRHVGDFCSACQAEWETAEEDGKEYCAYCGAEVAEEKASAQ